MVEQQPFKPNGDQRVCESADGGAAIGSSPISLLLAGCSTAHRPFGAALVSIYSYQIKSV